MNVLLFVRKDTTFKLVCVKLHIQWFWLLKPYVNLFVVWPSDLQFIRILIYFICWKIYLFIFIFLILVFVKKSVNFCYVFHLLITVILLYVFGYGLHADKWITFSEAGIESFVIIYININQIHDNTKGNKYYINQYLCFICCGTEAAGIVWTAQTQFHTIQKDCHFPICYIPSVY